MRNKRYINRKGPIIVYAAEGAKIVNAFRNIREIDICHVDCLNLQKLAPSGHLKGSSSGPRVRAIERLDSIYRTFDKASEKKKNLLPRPNLLNGHTIEEEPSIFVYFSLEASHEPDFV